MPDDTCSADDCERPATALGLCGAHRLREIRHGGLALPPLPCKVCNAPIERREGRGAPARFCSDPCRRIWERDRKRQRETPRTTFACATCGVEWYRPPARGQVPKYCPDCKAGRRPIVCDFCGQDAHIGYASVSKFCSPYCAQRDRAGWSRSKAIVRFVPPPEPPRDPPPPPTLRFAAGYCRRCGVSTVTDRLAGYNGRNAYCSAACLRADGKDRRRARKRSAYVADVRRKEIFERDGWRCQICGKATSRRSKVPHPRAPVIDHIVPLAAGGTHEPANVQCACHLCNCIKGDRAANDQLLLIG